ncbi:MULTISPECIES: WXG100 family type VII secretion target [Kitasatospora]|uniref:WXG100 family type VII secretion target n=1 Tax=Kitasatospora cystarginea TaxID=58350 RepID=A0ABN3DHX6_9ACTN
MAAGGSDQFRIKPWEVHGEGREFEQLSNDFARAALALEQGMAGLGSPWGKDDPGSGFGQEYDEAQHGVLAGLNGLADRLAGIGAGLHTMADQASQTEQDIAADFNRQHPGGTAAGRQVV